MRLNFVDLNAQYRTIKSEIDHAIQEVIHQSAFSAGPFVKSFEQNFAKTHQSKYCVGVNSGTSALHIALWALGIGTGDEVIVPSLTFIATAEAVSLCGATPVFADCDPDYYTIDPDDIEKRINSNTKAVLPVHLYGQPAKMDEIKAIADQHELLLIEDCAQAHLAEYKGKKVGTFGAAGCFSFYPGKNLGAYGEAGAVITDDDALYDRMLALRDHGSLKKYHHDLIGHNYRMDGLQGAVLDVKLKHLDAWTQARRKNAQVYRGCLEEIESLSLPIEMPDAVHVYHLFVVRAPHRDKLKMHLESHDIAVGIHYPIPCHLQNAYKMANSSICPVSERYAKEILSLPIHAEINKDDIRLIYEDIKTFYAGS